MDKDLILMETEFFVEANSHEILTLWQNYKAELDWKIFSEGFSVVIGYVPLKDGNEQPINVSMQFARINGKTICFYEAISDYVCHSAIEAYIKSFGKMYDSRWAICDAQNFHLCYHHIIQNKVLAKIEDKVEETNESWVRNQLSPVVNLFAMMDAGITAIDNDLFNKEILKVFDVLQAIGERIVPTESCEVQYIKNDTQSLKDVIFALTQATEFKADVRSFLNDIVEYSFAKNSHVITNLTYIRQKTQEFLSKIN